MKTIVQAYIKGTKRIGYAIGEFTSWFGLGILVTVLIAVVAGGLGLNQLLEWGFYIPILGEGLTINGIFDLEWHFFAVMVMFGGTYGYLENTHVRSDLIYASLPDHKKAWIDTIGDLFLLIPFCVIMTHLSWKFMMRSYKFSEQSDYGGLVDRFVVKSAMPLGFALLALVVFGRVLSRFVEVDGKKPVISFKK